MGISLYRQYRPQRFAEVAGQPAAVDVIVKSLRRERIGHAYLFSGPRGCGKTTVARLLAKALNCMAPGDAYEPCCECKNCVAIAAGESLDVIEIDGASNNSVDEVRELKSHVTLAPFASKYKVYIIDEVHMLSISAFNALLKTLEEPPAYVVFILATTEAHKVPVTIRSRCQHIPFHRIETQKIYDRLVEVCSGESIAFQREALWEIARQADGALRDGLSMLEQVANLGREEISPTDVEATLGQGSRSTLERWVGSWRNGDMETFCELDRMLGGGASPQRFLEELFSLCRNLWLVARWSGVLETLDASEQEKEYLKKEAPLWDLRELESVMRFVAELLPQVRMGLRMDVLSGLLMSKMAHPESFLPDPAETPPSREKRPAVVPVDRNKSEPPASPEEKTARRLPEKKESAPIKTLSPPKEEAPVIKDRALPVSVETPPDISTRESFSDERWNEILVVLRAQEYVLYCGLIGTKPSVSGERLVLEIPFRYCYETLRQERCRSSLKKALLPFWPEEIVLCFGDLTTSCDSARKNGDAGSQANGPTPLEGFEHAIADSPDEVKNREERPIGGVPFDGLVRGVQRVMRGEVILVRRGAGEDEEDDVPPAAEE